MANTAEHPEQAVSEAILATLIEQKTDQTERGFYWENQIAFAYNSDKMEGSPLTKEQTRSIFETKTITGKALPVDAIDEARNHFALFDRMLETAHDSLTQELILEYHAILKNGRGASAESSGFKLVPNAVDGMMTAAPEEVNAELARLLKMYDDKQDKTYETLAAFHVSFETIHPFQDGNGRIGRMILFKECLANGLEPFIVLDDRKDSYYNGLRSFSQDPGVLVSFFESMRDLYLTEYAALVPHWHLLPRLEEFAQHPENDLDRFFSNS